MGRLVVVAGALLALAPAAHAEVTIGSDLAAEPNEPLAFDPLGSTAAPVGATAPFSGVITRWRVRVGLTTTPVRLRVLRPSLGVEVGRSDLEPAPPVGSPRVVYETQIPVAQGDRIALECCIGTGGHFLVFNVGKTDVWSPPILNDQPFGQPSSTLDHGIALNADLERDIDGDGAGDDTQDDDDDGDGVPDATDDCPTKPASTANGCATPPPATRVNTPPVVRFRTPLAGTAVRASQAIELDVADDAGSSTVTVFDDDGTICALSGPPYSCTWRPTGADVGRATLLASAVDSDNRSTLGIVRVTVARFEADLTRRLRGRRVTGRLVLPAAVEKALGCRGEVTVRRGRTTRVVALKRNCTYGARLPRGRGRVRARFAGNSVVEPAT
jgi:Bacterial Ig domain